MLQHSELLVERLELYRTMVEQAWVFMDLLNRFLDVGAEIGEAASTREESPLCAGGLQKILRLTNPSWF